MKSTAVIRERLEMGRRGYKVNHCLAERLSAAEEPILQNRGLKANSSRRYRRSHALRDNNLGNAFPVHG